MDTPKPPNGQDMWNAIKEELVKNLYPLPFSTLPPTLYHVYVHQEDYEEIQGIVPRIVQELGKALTAEVQRMNQDLATPAGRFRSFLRPTDAAATEVEVPAGGWEIYIQPDHNGELPRGAMAIVSKLMMPAPPTYDGTPTMRVVKSVFAEGQRTTAAPQVQPVETAPAPSAPAAPSAAPAPATLRAKPAGPRATLVYQDNDGPHRFPVLKDCVKIGRGGDGAWVDVQLSTSASVSREHCWILNDAAGRFFIQDVSTRGTSVNGERLPNARRAPDGSVMEPGEKRELLPGAQIALADALVMHFHPGALA